MKIIGRYVLKEHVGPFLFASTALTSLMLLQYIAKKFGELVGRGLPARVITEFMALSLPFTIAMTMPMAVLVAVLYAFSRLAAENEITAMKASGVAMRSVLAPVLLGGLAMSLVMLWFNDQVLPRANHRLAVLQLDIFKTKPTFALREQVINPVKEGQLYLRAGHIDPGTSSMKDVVIYDLSDPTRRRTIYADSGILASAANHKDLDMTLFHGVMQEIPNNRPNELARLFYRKERLRVKSVFSSYEESRAGTVSKGDREMSICEMHRELARGDYQVREADYQIAQVKYDQDTSKGSKPKPPSRAPRLSLSKMYCGLLKVAGPRQAQAQAPARAAAQSARGDSARARDSAVAAARLRRAEALNASDSIIAAPSIPPGTPSIDPVKVGYDKSPGYLKMRLQEAQLRRQEAVRERNRYDVEIQKKFSLAAACVIFVLVGAPIALRFPRGGVGLVIGVSFMIFGLYYVGLIGGETLADKALLPPWIAMWGANLILSIVGLVLASQMGRESTTTRGGDFRELMTTARARIFGWMRSVGVPVERRRA